MKKKPFTDTENNILICEVAKREPLWNHTLSMIDRGYNRQLWEQVVSVEALKGIFLLFK